LVAEGGGVGCACCCGCSPAWAATSGPDERARSFCPGRSGTRARARAPGAVTLTRDVPYCRTALAHQSWRPPSPPRGRVQSASGHSERLRTYPHIERGEDQLHHPAR
jgi:hypothetical protein